MNALKLKGIMVEKECSMQSLADRLEMDRSSLYRKMNNGEKFTIGEAQKIKDTFNLTGEDAAAIFLISMSHEMRKAKKRRK